MADKQVKARVVRGQFAERGEDGSVKRFVKPTDDDPFVMVTEAQLKSFVGVLARAGSEDEEAAVAATANERAGKTTDASADDLAENTKAAPRRR